MSASLLEEQKEIQMEWIDICAVEDIPVLGSRIVRRPTGQDIAVFRNSEEQVFALLDECPHKKAYTPQTFQKCTKRNSFSSFFSNPGAATPPGSAKRRMTARAFSR